MNRKRGSSSVESDDSIHSSTPPSISKKRSAYAKFTQQELAACKPLLSPTAVIWIFAITGIIFIPVGITCLFASAHVVEIVDRYDADCVPKEHGDVIGFIQSSETNKTCIRSLFVQRYMQSPVYVYYQLDGFYQNHRRYVKSRSDFQLLDAKYQHVHSTSKCLPEANTEDGSPIIPCGLVAWSLFNDSYSFSVNSEVLEVDRKNIAWESDKKHKFGKDVYPKNFQRGTLIGGGTLNSSIPLSEQEDLMVWMRTAALPTFRKLYGKIEADLGPNEVVTVAIQNNYNTYSFGGKKTLVLSTSSWIGGKNDFLGEAYLGVGLLCLLLALAFLLLHVIKPRTLGDPAYLSRAEKQFMVNTR